ncbi:MAG TPA: nucleotide disphospho-sugar-binding domain-containing protein [Candidatus Angelobacter sp.]|nr:nucleotide disphospho-sugar-binding domain-containing protein [Candidatus Angelobacter sp.]
MTRVLVATTGSAGDLFPLLPIVDDLSARGHDATLLVPRFLSLHLRMLRRPHEVYGASRDMPARGARTITTRFAGWASWRRLAVGHLAPRLADDVAGAGAAIDRWHPDVVATTTFAVAPRIAAAVRGIPHVAVSLTPQLLGLPSRSHVFARPLVEAVAAAAPSLRAADAQRLAWGGGAPAVLLHDPALLDISRLPGVVETVGHPSWDAVPPATRDVEAAEAWLDDRSTPVVLVTLGSYAGHPALVDAITAAIPGNVRLLCLNRARRGLHGNVLSTGFLPVSQVAPRCAAVVHHGGLGTTIAALRAARACVVVPQAFDQACNAALVRGAGAGLAATVGDVAAAVDAVLARVAFAQAAAQIATALISADAAASRAATLVLAAAERAHVHGR